VAGVAVSRPRVLNSVGVVAAVHGVALQGRGRPHRTDGDGDGAPAKRRHGLTLQSHERRVRGCDRPPSRARCISRTGVGGTVSRS
jgi:hypothetical protein